MARDPQDRPISEHLRIQILRGNKVIKTKDLPDYAEVVIHTNAGKVKRVKTTVSEDVE